MVVRVFGLRASSPHGHVRDHLMVRPCQSWMRASEGTWFVSCQFGFSEQVCSKHDEDDQESEQHKPGAERVRGLFEGAHPSIVDPAGPDTPEVVLDRELLDRSRQRPDEPFPYERVEEAE